MRAPLVLETGQPGIELRELATPEDDVAYFDGYNASRSEISVFDPEADTKHVTLADTAKAREEAGNKIRMGMWDGDTFVASFNATPRGSSMEVSYWTHSAHTRKGYATLGARVISSYVSEYAAGVFANVHQGNHASARVLAKAGYEYLYSGSAENYDMYSFRYGAPCLFPIRCGHALEIPRGDYRIVEGSDAPVSIREGQITYFTDEEPIRPSTIPGVTYRGWYTNHEAKNEWLASFLYHKQNEQGQLEVDERIIIMRGIGFGQHPAHGNQLPTWYLVGAQIGTRDRETGMPIDFPNQDVEVPVKHFSLACIKGEPLGRLVLANA